MPWDLFGSFRVCDAVCFEHGIHFQMCCCFMLNSILGCLVLFYLFFLQSLGLSLTNWFERLIHIQHAGQMPSMCKVLWLFWGGGWAWGSRLSPRPGVVLLAKPGNTEVKRRRRGGLGHSQGVWGGGGSRETALLALDMGEAGGVQCVKRGKGFDSKWQSWELLASRLCLKPREWMKENEFPVE